MTTWIDVKEWLPEDNIDVQVKVTCELDVRIVTAFYSRDNDDDYKGKWYLIIPLSNETFHPEIREIFNVTHWTLLPEE